MSAKRTMTRSYDIVTEIPWHRKAHEERETYDELCSEAVEVAILQ